MASSSSISNHYQEGDKAVASEETPLHKHITFFDRNKDGVVYPWETYQGLRALGRGILVSAIGALLVNIIVSPKTRPGKRFNILFPIEVKNIHLAKHGSDSGAFDTHGRFVPSKFEEIFTKHAHSHPDALTYEEVKEMLKARREPKDYFGWANAQIDWKAMYDICKDENGLLQKETVRALYAGNLLEQVEEEISSKKKKL